MAEEWKHAGLGSRSDVRIDPYYLWAEATQFVYLFGTMEVKPRFTVSIRVRDPFTAKQLADGHWGSSAPPNGWQEWLTIPKIYSHPPLGLEGSQICTASVAPKFFAELRNPESLLSKVVWRVSLGLPLPPRPDWKPAPPPPDDVTVPSPGVVWWHRIVCKVFPGLKICKQPPALKPRTKVVTGIIDDGLAFANERFRSADGKTRVEFFWNQDGLLYPPSDLYPYGLELRKDDSTIAGIDTQIGLSTRVGITDEDWVYTRTGHLSYGERGHKPVSWREAHGTHVMDLACGYDAKNAPLDRPIMAVQLPVAATADTSGGTLIPYVLDGINYILSRSGSTPVVINLSYGITAGPHDGSSDFEAAVDKYVLDRRAAGAPLAVVLPSGNSRLLRGHAKFTLGAKGSDTDKAKLRWRILPDDATPSYLEIWLPPSTGPGPKVKVKVQPPWGAESPSLEEGNPPLIWVPNGQILCHFSYVNAGLSNHRGMILVAVVATTTHNPGQQVAPFGEWKISIKNISTFPIKDVRAWIRRDDTPYGYPVRGRQSRFIDRQYLRYDDAGRNVEVDNASYIKRDGTISSLAAGKETIVVGGFKRTNWQPANYSASGPVVSPPGRTGASSDGPDGVAVSDDSHMHHGVLAAGTRSGSTVAMYGTSVAAPQVTRWAVEHMSRYGDCTRAQFHKFVTQGLPASPWANTRTEVNRPPGIPATVPPVLRIGGGRVEFPPGNFPLFDPSAVDRKIERT